jgi:hypothetical protein
MEETTMRFLTSEKVKYVVLYVSALSVHLAVVLMLLAIAMDVDLGRMTLATLL